MSTTPFPTGGRAIIDRMKARYPELAVNVDDLQRELTKRIGEQFAFTYGPQWGNKKRAGLSDDFRSKDSIAVREDDGTTSVWDMFKGDSSVETLPSDGDPPKPGSHANLPPGEATFMPCDPVNHLDAPPPPDEEEEGEEPGPDVEAELRLVLTRLMVRQEELSANVAQALNQLGFLLGRHDPAPALSELREQVIALAEQVRRLELKGGNRPFTTATWRNPHGWNDDGTPKEKQ